MKPDSSERWTAKRLRCKSCKLQQRKLQLNIRKKKLLIVNVVKHRNRLLRDFAESASLEVCRPCLAKALTTVVVVIQQLWLLTLLWIRVWTRWPLQIPPILNFSVIFVHEKYANGVYLHSMLDVSKKIWIVLFGHMHTNCMMYSDTDRKTDVSQKRGTYWALATLPKNKQLLGKS